MSTQELNLSDLAFYILRISERRNDRHVTEKEFEVLLRVFKYVEDSVINEFCLKDVVADPSRSRTHINGLLTKDLIVLKSPRSGALHTSNTYTLCKAGTDTVRFILGIRNKK